jgi:hypothetical protein
MRELLASQAWPEIDVRMFSEDGSSQHASDVAICRT